MRQLIPFAITRYSPEGSQTLSRAFNVLHKRLIVAVGNGVETRSLHLILTALGHLDLLQAEDFREKYVSWIGVIFGSGHYSERDKYLLASDIMLLLMPRKGVDLQPWESLPKVQPAELPSLLKFLLLSEKYNTGNDLSYSNAIALRLLSLNYDMARGDLSPLLVPVLTSTLSTTRPLPSRIFALKLFQEHGPEWFSPQMEQFSDVVRLELLNSLGDPFHPSADLTSDTEHLPTVQIEREPTDTAILLIGFASSDLWNGHLRHSNFSSCEEIFFTGWGKRLAIDRMSFKQTYFGGGEFLDTPTKLIAAIKRLRDLQCWNTAEVVILYAWTGGALDPVDHDAWGLIGHETGEFYRARGMAPSEMKLRNQEMRGGVTIRRVEVNGVQRPVRLATDGGLWDSIHSACQLKRFYQLLGHDPVTWVEIAAVADVDGDVMLGIEPDSERGATGVSTFTQFLDFTCDFP